MCVLVLGLYGGDVGDAGTPGTRQGGVGGGGVSGVDCSASDAFVAVFIKFGIIPFTIGNGLYGSATRYFFLNLNFASAGSASTARFIVLYQNTWTRRARIGP
jgi:hypothetical protein